MAAHNPVQVHGIFISGRSNREAMGAHQVTAPADVVGYGRGRTVTPVAIVESAIDQVLRRDSLDALPSLLAQLVTVFSARMALVLQPRAGQPATVLAAYPDTSAADQDLIGRISAVCQPLDPATGSCVDVPLPRQRGLRALLAFSAPVGGQCLCALALVAKAPDRDSEARPALGAVATVVAAQIRHANDMANLAGQQALAQTLIDGSPNAVVAADAARRIVAFNPAAEQLFGYRRADVLGQVMTQLLIPERERAAFVAHTERHLATGDSREYTGRMRVPVLRADGTERFAELAGAEVTWGGKTYFCGFLRDLTEQEHAEAALTETRARFLLLTQLAPVAIVQTDAAGEAIFVNDRWCVMTAARPGASLGRGWLDRVHPADRERFERDLAATAREGEFRAECRLLATDGRVVWATVSAVALHASDGSALGFLAAFTDISDAKQAEAERERLLAAERAARISLAGQTERLNCLIDNAIPGVLITDERGLITHISRSFGTMFGIQSPDSLVGTPAADLVRRIKETFADPEEFARRTAAASAGRQPVSGEQMTARDGRTLECDYWPVLAGGHYGGDLWLAWDMSEQKELEEQRDRLLEAELAARRSAELGQRQLEEQNEKLRQLDDAKTQFLATVSHELRTPLTSIVSFSELMRAETEALTPDGAQFLDIIERNAHRLLRLVGDLLLLTRLESGSIPLELETVSVPELVEEAASTAAARAAKQNVTVHWSTEEGPLLQADRTRLFQVLDNLIGNAVKFSRAGGLVRIDAVRRGQGWRIDVADCGIGIPPDEIDQLFGRFVRATNARTGGLPGTGLGLSIVKAIAELHGGRVTVESTLGRGTTFSVHLPGPAAPPERAQGPA